MVGLLVSLGAFAGYFEQHGDGAAGTLLTRFEALAADVGRRQGMTPAKTADGGILLLGSTEETAVTTAHALSDELQPEAGHIPVHIVGLPGNVVRLEDGQTVELTARLHLTAHPGEAPPATR